MNMSCPYSNEELLRKKGETKPIGEACNDCRNYDCEHNPNDPTDPLMVVSPGPWIEEKDKRAKP